MDKSLIIFIAACLFMLIVFSFSAISFYKNEKYVKETEDSLKNIDKE